MKDSGEFFANLERRALANLAVAKDSAFRSGAVLLEDFDTGVDPTRMELKENWAYISLIDLFSMHGWINPCLYRELTSKGKEIAKSFFGDSLDPLVGRLLVDAHADYRLSGQTIIPMDNYILNVARELRFVQPLFRGGKHHYLEEELLIALNHEVLPQVFRFPESVLGGFYVIGKGVENGQLEVNPQEAYRSEPIDEAEQKLVRALEQKGWKVHPPMKKAGCTLKYTKEHK